MLEPGGIGILVFYFAVGALLDILGVVDVKAIQHGQAGRSAIVSFVLTVISYVCFYFIIQSPQALIEILFYALGGAVGAYYIIKKGYK